MRSAGLGTVLERGIAIADANPGSNHAMRVRLLSIYAHVLRALHRDREAKAVEKQALAIKKDHPAGLTVDISELSKTPAPKR